MIAARTLEPRLHQYIIDTVSKSLESEVELGETRITWFPLRIHASGLIVRHHGRTDVPPLLVLNSFTVDFKLNELFDERAQQVRIDGMEINIPPKQPGTPRIPHPKTSDSPAEDQGDQGKNDGGVLIRKFLATNVRLAVIPRDPNKNPRVWDIHSLELKNLQSEKPAPYDAALINPIPFGTIESKGEFGPWNADEPGETPLAGNYTFSADLGTIDGLGGHLDAEGSMKGIIERLETEGTTSTDDFALTSLQAHTLPLKTRYQAIVDGTKGDVDLKDVELQLGRSVLHARGTIEGSKGVKGKRVIVNVKSDAVDVTELFRLLTKKPPQARGTLAIDASMDLPQGKADILDKLAVEGSIRASRVIFTDDAIQNKVDKLSRMGRGRPVDQSIDNVASQLTSTFAMKRGVLQFKNLTFDVDGASIQLNGTHALRPKTLDLAGQVRLQSGISKTQTGFKRWLLRPFDPLFRHRGRSTIAITVEGTSEKPVLGVDLKKSIKGG